MAEPAIEPMRRVIIENVQPEVDGGAFAAKRTLGEAVEVTADIFCDGHDVLRAALLVRVGSGQYEESPMEPLVNDAWRGGFRAREMGTHYFAVEAWVDHFASWRRDLGKKFDAGQDVAVELLVGANWIEEAAARAKGAERAELQRWADSLRKSSQRSQAEAVKKADSAALAELMGRYPDRSRATRSGDLPVTVDRERARFGAWYEMFPRSAGAKGKHGTLRDVEKRLAYVAEMGFDVLYLPPIHPIGQVNRKGKNNVEKAGPGDVGSPWAIGSDEGGHKAIHPQLGTLDDFKRLMARAGELGIELAMDIAFQTAPDHPYVKEHREWFRIRPDGAVQYAENPPKKYQDIYPINFETEHSRALCEELKSVVTYWAGQGVRIFRVDNPHTKPFPFWQWLIAEVKRDYPDAIFLAEAFTRPKIMYRLAKLGFTQSYTYFAWRNTRQEITEYFRELTKTKLREFFRPNLWPNTPDIMTEFLQFGGRPAFALRLVLAATLGASYGIYGPAYELSENEPLRPGSEEYLNSEKYEVRHWDLDRPDSLRGLIATVNRIRRENPALQGDWNLRFHKTDNEKIIAYSKCSQDLNEVVVVIVNLDPYYKQSGWVELPQTEFQLDAKKPFQMHDLLSGARFLWQGARNYVELDPKVTPAHIFRLRRHVRTERDFDYFM